jgi:2-methylaconitate cis-trans-isomerase PrpF
MNVVVPTPARDKGDVFPALPEMTVRVRNGVVEFPVHHVRGGTSTGLVIWDRFAPEDVSLREELLRHLMGVPLTGTRPGNKQLTGLGRVAPTGNKVFFAAGALGPAYSESKIGIENPAGVLDAAIEARITDNGVEIAKAAYKRSTQMLLAGYVPLYHASPALRQALL